MKRVPLHGWRGVVTGHVLVDDADYDDVMAFRWHKASTGYARRVIPGASSKCVYLHRQLLSCTPGDGVEVDHINGDRLDCRRSNLRLANRELNQQNRAADRGSTSKHRGVCWHPATNKWLARVHTKGKDYYLGIHDDEEEAARIARDFREAILPFAVHR